jgi:hypothetical protein
MKPPRDARFDDEAARYALRMHCEDCALFDARREACAHGFPTAEHRRAAAHRLVVFCKEFDLA